MIKQNVGEFYCTDDDCYQYCKEISSVEYQFTQIQWLDSDSKENEYCVTASGVINIDNMSIDEIETAISGYYGSFYEMLEQCQEMPVVVVFQLIAECAFENESFDNSISDVMSLDECIKFQHDWMLKNS